MTFIRQEPAPQNSLLRGATVVFEEHGKLWRCAAVTWERMVMDWKKVRVLKEIARKGNS